MRRHNETLCYPPFTRARALLGTGGKSMRIADLEYLVELERCGSISKTAREGFISQQGLSRVIDSMEKELGTQLFIRSRSGVHLTEAGKAFVEHAKCAVESYHHGLEALEERKHTASSDILNISMSSYIPIVLFDRMMSRVRFDGRVSYREKRLKRIEAELAEGSNDVLYLADWIDGTICDKDSVRSSYEVVKMFRSPFGIVTAGMEPSPSITIAELAKRPLASFGGEDYNKTTSALLGSDIIDNAVISLPSRQAISSVLADVEGSCYTVDRFSVTLRGLIDSNTAFYPIKPPTYLNIGFVYRKDSPKSQRYRDYIDAWDAAFKNIIPRSALEVCDLR